MTAAQARTGALCEALERYSGLHRGDEPRRRGRLADIGEDAIHPARALHFSDAQYAEREAWNAALAAAATPKLARQALWVPEPFDAHAEVDWTPLWSLSEGRVRWLPTACCYFHAPPSVDPPELPRFAAADSNGCAAGTCVEEAILQGFLELVERDAVALWWYNRVRRPALDLANFEGASLDPAGLDIPPRLRRAIETSLAVHQRLDRRLDVLDVTSDFGFPTYAAVSRAVDPDGEPQGDGNPVFGFGCHLDAGLALARALTELGQSLPGLLAGEGDAGPKRVLSGRLDESAFLDPDGYVDLPATAARSTSLRAAVELGVERARELGLETLVLDQTRPEVGLTVVRVVVPGLRHFRPRRAPGRLYDVPVRLGWLPVARREDELHSVHLLT